MPYKDPENRKRYDSEYRKKYKERRAVLMKQWMDRNKDKYDKYQAEYRTKNRESRNAKRMAFYYENKDVELEKRKQWRINNPKWGKEYYKKNREKLLAKNKLSYLRHRDQRLIDAREYAKNNPHIVIKRHALRRMRIEATIENESAIADFIKMVRGSKWVYCKYCDDKVPGKKAHIDHIIPLSRGGSHKPDNLCVSCAHCNLTKSAKLISEWKRIGQQILPFC